MPDLSSLPPSRATIGKWSVDRYVDVLRNWIIGAAVVIVVLVLDQKPQTMVMILELAFLLLVGWLVARQHGGKVESLTAGAMAGLALGLVVGVGHFIVSPRLYWALRSLLEIVVTGFLGTLVAVIGYQVSNIFSKTSTH